MRALIHRFAAVLKYAEPFAVSDDSVGQGVRTAIAEDSGDYGPSRNWLTNLSAYRGRSESRVSGVTAGSPHVRTRIYGAEELAAGVLSRVVALEEFLRPKDLVDRVRGLVLGRSGSFDVDDLDDSRDGLCGSCGARAAATAEQLGRDAVADERTFRALLPELLVAGGRVADFGRGVAFGAGNPRETGHSGVGPCAIVCERSRRGRTLVFACDRGPSAQAASAHFRLPISVA